MMRAHLSIAALNAISTAEFLKTLAHNGPGRRSLFTYWKNVRLRRPPFIDSSMPNTRQRLRALQREQQKIAARKQFGTGARWREIKVPYLAEKAAA